MVPESGTRFWHQDLVPECVIKILYQNQAPKQANYDTRVWAQNLGPESGTGTWQQNMVPKSSTTNLVPGYWYQNLVPDSGTRDLGRPELGGSGHGRGRGAKVFLQLVRHLHVHSIFWQRILAALILVGGQSP